MITFLEKWLTFKIPWKPEDYIGLDYLTPWPMPSCKPNGHHLATMYASATFLVEFGTLSS